MSVIFSPINKSQIEEVLDFWKIHAENHSRPFDSAGLVIQLIERDPDAIILAINEGKIVGTVIVGWDGWRGSIYRLAVDGNLKGQGLGRQLMEKAEERLKTLGATRVNAVVYEGNLAAHSFYHRLGYSKQLEWARWIKDVEG